ncbi:MAG: aminoacetone oxidase family FAD-binding enzyme [Lachnospiraceae bacterium]|nr:aminoacetone oxidase family FAD-binding enzyme [Lachnospiraceae bacterium]
MSKVLVVGGGAAGMMAAYKSASCGDDVILFEKNEKLGKKVYITGKGRCNVTNAADMEEVFASIITNAKFMYSSFAGFDNRSVMELIEGAGCPLKIERGNRVFPVSDHSSDVLKALLNLLNKNHVDIRYEHTVTDIIVENDEFKAIKVKDRSGKESAVEGDKCIICTGGLSYPLTGSSGDGHEFAKKLGLKVTDCNPSLVPFNTVETWPKSVMGLALKNVELTMADEKKVLYKGFGEMLFTHFGVSGPLVLTASCYYKKRKSDNVSLFIDLKPALDIETLDKRIIKEFDENRNRNFKNAIASLFPSGLIPVMVELSGIDPDKKVNEISKAERRSFSELIKKVPLHVSGVRSYAEAIITQGGVSVKEINPTTMESKKVKGLFFAGEVLDVDAVTGGFNLQIAWSTGYAAGKNALKEE